MGAALCLSHERDWPRFRACYNITKAGSVGYLGTVTVVAVA